MSDSGQKKGRSKRMKILLGLLALVVIVGGAVMFLFSSPSVTSPEAAVIQPIIPDINFSVLDSEIFERFKVWSVIPVQVPETGKENPFID